VNIPTFLMIYTWMVLLQSFLVILEAELRKEPLTNPTIALKFESFDLPIVRQLLTCASLVQQKELSVGFATPTSVKN